MKKYLVLSCLFFSLFFVTPVFAAGNYTISSINPRSDGFIRVIIKNVSTDALAHRFISNTDTNKNVYLAALLTAMNNGWTLNVTKSNVAGKAIITSFYIYSE